MRNHGLKSRNKNIIFGYNSRLDTLQAVVANHLLKKIKFITKKRIQNSNYLNYKISKLKNFIIKPQKSYLKEVYHLYEFRVLKSEDRKKLVNYLRKNNIDAKIHYPVPMHLQPAAKKYNYKKGDFPVTELIANSTISLPVHEFLNKKDMDYMIGKIKGFYNED